jgi:drug/metabolite transporter (DMT)-like permease
MYHQGTVLTAAWIYAAFLLVNRAFLADPTVSPYLFAFVSVLSTGVVSWIFLLHLRGVSVPGTLSISAWIMLLVHGAVMGGVARFILCYGQVSSSSINAGFLTRISPLLAVALAYVFLREPLSGFRILVILMMTCGGMLVSPHGALDFSGMQQGDMILLFYAFLLGFGQVWTRRVITLGMQSMVVSAMRFFVGTLAIGLVFGGQVLWSIASLEPWMPHALSGRLITDNMLTGNVLLGGFLSGLLLFCTGLTRDWGLTYLPASIVSALMLWSPVFGVFMSMAVLHERMSVGQMIGSGIILGGGYLLHCKAPNLRLKPPKEPGCVAYPSSAPSAPRLGSGRDDGDVATFHS